MNRDSPIIIGNATLYLGDCRDVLPSLPCVDLVMTSPPYNQLGERMPDKPSGIWKDMGRGFLDSVNSRGYADDVPEEEYQRRQNELFSSINVSASASLFYNHQCRWRDGNLLHPVHWFKPDGWSLRQEIIWDRAGGMMFNARMFCRFDERILWFSRNGEHQWNQECVGLGTIWRIPRETNKDHPVSYPVEIPGRCIGAATTVGDTVLDPYAGSGTTGVAALKMGRRFIGIEIDPRYFEIACRRVELASRQPDMFIEQPEPSEQLEIWKDAAE